MSLEILALNPAKPRTRKAKKKGVSMANKKRSGSSSKGKGRSKRRASVSHMVRTNPGEEVFLVNPPPSRARRAARRVGGFVQSSGIGGAMRSAIPMVAGALAGKLAQKKFGDKTDEAGNWTWKDYLTGALGVVAASYVAKGLFKASPATSQKVLEGGFTMLAFKLVTQELVPMSDTAKEWLGEEGDGTGAADEGSWAGQVYDIGDLYEAQNGSTWVLGQDGLWRNADQSARLPAFSGEGYDGAEESYGMGDALTPPGRLGDALTPPGRLGMIPNNGAGQNSNPFAWGQR